MRKVGDGMTIREFSDKYGIPYGIAYEATYKVPSYSTLQKDREYPEDQMFAEAERIISARMKKHRGQYEKAKKYIISLHSAKRKELIK